MVKTILRLVVSTAQHVTGQLSRHQPVATDCTQVHDSTIDGHLLNSVDCRMDYYLEFFTVFHRALTILHVDIWESVVVNIQRSALSRKKEFKHKLALFRVPVAKSTPN